MATTPNERTIKRYMLAEYRDHVDPRTNELNITGLAEDAIHHFNLDGGQDDPVWDYASEVMDQLVKAGKVADF